MLVINKISYSERVFVNSLTHTGWQHGCKDVDLLQDPCKCWIFLKLKELIFKFLHRTYSVCLYEEIEHVFATTDSARNNLSCKLSNYEKKCKIKSLY